MTDKAILDDSGNVVPVDDLLEWAEWFEANPDKRRIALTEFESGLRVSTVFLGLNHAWDDGPGQWFECMVFGPREEREIFGRKMMIGEEMFCQRSTRRLSKPAPATLTRSSYSRLSGEKLPMNDKSIDPLSDYARNAAYLEWCDEVHESVPTYAGAFNAAWQQAVRRSDARLSAVESAHTTQICALTNQGCWRTPRRKVIGLNRFRL